MVKDLLQQRGLARRWAATNCLAGLIGAGLLLAPAAQAQTANALSGAYTINSAQATAGTNFASFSDAATRLNTDGVSGPVTITVSGGPYTEQFLLGEIAGTSATNLLVINGGGRTIQFASANNAQRAVVQLNGTDYTTINNLVINAASGTYGCGILLTNMANNDKLTNNVITADLASTSTNYAGIVTSGSTSSYTAAGVSANNLLIEGNTITGGYYGIGLYGNTTAAPNTGNIVRNNVVKDFYVNGIYLGFQEGTLIVGNDVSRPTRTTLSGFNGIYAFGTSRGISIEKNRIHDPFTGAPASTDNCYPVFLATGTGATASSYNDVVNNVIYNLNGAGPQYGVYSSGAAFVRIYNNSISAEDQNTAATSAAYGIYSSGASSDVRNNVVRITRTGAGNKYGLYYATNAPVSNYNDVYVPGGNVGYYTSAYPALNNWQGANGGIFDQNSLSVDPQYVDATTGNLLPANVALNNVGQPLARVTDDINGAARGAVPDMGAYEFTPVALDLAPMSLLSPATGTTCYGTAEAVTVQVRSGGTVPLDFAANAITVTVVVTPPTGAAQTFTTTLTSGTLASGGTRNVTMPSTLDMSALGTYSFAVTATVAGDQNTSNDLLAPAPTRTAVAPVAGTLSPATNTICRSGTAPLSLSGSANGSVQYQSSSSASGPFTDVAGATSASYTTPVLTSTTYYRVRTTCNANTVYSNVATITVSNPQLVSASSTPQSVCAGSTATLSGTASAGNSVRFYSAAMGGTPLASTAANTATTLALSASTTFYAEAYSGSVERVGPASNSFGLGSGTNSTNGLIFTNNTVGVLTSVSVYPTVAGVSSIQLLNSAGIVLQVYQATFTASDLTKKTVVPLNFPLPAATDLKLQVLNTGSTASLYRNTTAAVYPYTSPSGQISITGNTLATSPATYFYFYDWEVNTECAATTRTPVQVIVTPAPATPTLTASPQANGSVLLTASSSVSGATYQFYANGSPVGTASTTNTLTLQSGAANGSYTVAITSGGCASAQSAAVAVTVTGTRATANLEGVSLRVYPNPTPDGQLTLELAGPKAKASALTVINALGQVVLTQPVAAGTSALRLSSLAAGVYVLRVQTPEGVLTQRIVRE